MGGGLRNLLSSLAGMSTQKKVAFQWVSVGPDGGWCWLKEEEEEEEELEEADSGGVECVEFGVELESRTRIG